MNCAETSVGERQASHHASHRHVIARFGIITVLKSVEQ
jgi:hypothetical protein